MQTNDLRRLVASILSLLIAGEASAAGVAGIAIVPRGFAPVVAAVVPGAIGAVPVLPPSISASVAAGIPISAAATSVAAPVEISARGASFAAANPAAGTVSAAPAAIAQLRDALGAWDKPAAGAADESAAAAPADAFEGDQLPKGSQDFGKMFDLTRRMLSRPTVQKFMRKAFAAELALTPEQQSQYGLPAAIKEVSESQFVMLLALNPGLWPQFEKYLGEIETAQKRKKSYAKVSEKWLEYFGGLLKQDEKIAEKFKKMNDATEPMRLEWSGGRPGYSNQKFYANHARIVDGKTTAPEDLKKVVIDFIGGAKKELMFNVFDFDLMDVADAMIAAADRGVKVSGGIYKQNIDDRPEVKAVFDKLKAHKNITMRAVDSVGLNHQKLVIRDWSDEKSAASLLSSGNFTQSCIGPEGDLVAVPMAGRDEKTAESVPNANHMVVLEGYLVAQVIANKLTETLDYGLRGDGYPLGGAFKIFGPKPAGAKEAPYVVLSFSPKGMIGDVNRDMIRRVLLETRGALRAMVFAFSSQTVYEAILERARREKADGNVFDFKAFGDTPFTMRDYSVLLKLAGRVVDTREGKKQYYESEPNELRDIVGKEAYAKIVENIKIAPHAYGEHVTEDGTKFNAKIHHKVFISGDMAILGSSFNPSDNAEHNNEQIMATNDPALVGPMTEAFDGLYAQSQRSVDAEAVRRNERDEVSTDVVDKQSELDDAQAAKSAKAAKKKAAKK